jgi:hypothetical protein
MITNLKTVMKLSNCYKILFFACSLILFGCSDSSTGPDNGNGDEFNNQNAPGESARAFLNDEDFTRLDIEIDYMEGFQPTQDALNSLQSFLEARLNKSQINISTSAIPAEGQNAYTTEDIRNLEEENRNTFTDASGNTLNAYFIIVDGQSDQSNVLGIAYFNTSMALFGETVDNISGGVTQPSRTQVEATVLRHEFGHNMGLVGNGTPIQSDHQEQGAHCTTDGCLMEAEVETTNFFQNFTGSVPDLEQFCIEDLQANGGA